MTLVGDPALETLFEPFAEGSLAWPAGGALFLQARDGWPLHRQALPGLVCATDFKPDADALQRSGCDVRTVESLDGSPGYPLVLVLPPRQREHARALFARALAATAQDGIVIACASNDEGAKSAQADLARLAGPLQSHSKRHCRVFWSAPLQGPVDRELAAQWRDADQPRVIAEGRFRSRPGVFAWDRIDPASALLAAHLPPELSGRGADLGAGFGVLAAEVLARCAGVTALDLYEADARALALARDNLARTSDAALEFHWHDVTTGLPRTYDFIVSNPPFHAQGRADRPDIGRAFIAAAANALRDGGRLLLVANRHLPYEAELAARFEQVRTLAQQGGFKIIDAVRSGPSR